MYFARDAATAVKYAAVDKQGFKRLLVCRVAVGDWCKGSSELKTPPPRPGEENRLFDSTVDVLSWPSMFVVFHDAQVYPEYLITFQI